MRSTSSFRAPFFDSLERLSRSKPTATSTETHGAPTEQWTGRKGLTPGLAEGIEAKEYATEASSAPHHFGQNLEIKHAVMQDQVVPLWLRQPSSLLT